MGFQRYNTNIGTIPKSYRKIVDTDAKLIPPKHIYISRWSVLLVEETGVPGENHRPIANH